MATRIDFVEFLCEQLEDVGEISFKKMFGEYMVYRGGKLIFLVCENTVYVKILNEVESLLSGCEKGIPYKGAKEHYILDVDDAQILKEVALILEKITKFPKPRKKQASK